MKTKPKRILGLPIFLILSFSFLAFQSISVYAYTEVCILHMEEGSGNTTSGSGYTWTMGNPDRVNWTTGRIGNGLDFKYASFGAYISTPDDGTLNLSIFSIAMWFRVEDMGSSCDRLLYEHYKYSGGFPWGVLLYLGISTGFIEFWLCDGTASYESFTGDTDYRDNEWHHAVATFNGTYGEVFVDNNYVGNVTGNIIYHASPFIAIGGDESANSLGGTIDEFYLTSTVLTDQEIEALYEAGQPQPSLMSQWIGIATPYAFAAISVMSIALIVGVGAAFLISFQDQDMSALLPVVIIGLGITIALFIVLPILNAFQGL